MKNIKHTAIFNSSKAYASQNLFLWFLWFSMYIKTLYYFWQSQSDSSPTKLDLYNLHGYFHAAVVPKTHTHPFNGPLSRTTRWAGIRKVKSIWILLKQEIVSGSGISWAICKSAPRSRQITTPAHHHSVFLQAGCPSSRPTNSVKALKAYSSLYQFSWKSCCPVCEKLFRV